MEKICFNCFHEVSGDGKCPYCGYDPAADTKEYPLALPLMTVLNGRYQLGRALGQGGFGITYVARDVQTRSRIAVKEYLPTEFALREPGGTELKVYSSEAMENYLYGKSQFLEEARTLAALVGNEHIIRIESYFEENGTAYYTMEYIEGPDLKDYLMQNGGPLSIDRVNTFLLPVMESLRWVHSKGIIHRDIAPDNIIIRKDGVPKLIDFGAARYSTGEKSQSLDVILKHGFAPKEQYMRRGRQGPFTDVYAMAATYYYALTGRVPPDAVERMEEDRLVPPSELGAKIRPKTEKVLLKALAVAAEDRYQSMADFYAELVETMPHPFAPDAALESEKERKKRETEEKKAQRTAEKQARQKAPSGKAGGKGAVIAAILVLLLAGAGLGVKFGLPALRYQKATQLMAAQEYQQAADLLKKMKGYRDSKELLAEAKQALAYEEAESLFAAGDYAAAAAAFEALGDYQDSAEKIAEVEAAALTAEKEAVYETATAQMAAGAYEDAYELLLTIPDYGDVPELLTGNRDLLSAKRRIALRTPGSELVFGRYEQDNDLDNGSEEIEWIVLDVQENRSLLVSKYALDCKNIYEKDPSKVTWDKSDLRKWMNGDFLDTAFSEEERPGILLTEVDNSPDQGYFSYRNVPSGDNTEDYVFALSYAEVKQYFPSYDTPASTMGYDDIEPVSGAACTATAYAVARGARAGKNSADWWLRSPGWNSKCGLYVLTGGVFDSIVPHYLSEGTARPAMWVDRTSEVFR